MKITITDKDSVVLAEWEVIEKYPEDFDIEDLDDTSLDDKIILSDVKDLIDKSSFANSAATVECDALTLWQQGYR
jgi:hypothetical protein